MVGRVAGLPRRDVLRYAHGMVLQQSQHAQGNVDELFQLYLQDSCAAGWPVQVAVFNIVRALSAVGAKLAESVDADVVNGLTTSLIGDDRE